MKMYVRGYNGQGFGSGFIRWFTFGNYSHVSMVFHDHDEHVEVESIQGEGVIRHDPYKLNEKDFDEFVVPISELQAIDAKIIACGLLGAKYDWQGIWGFLRKKKRHSEEKWFCSEIVAYVLYKVGHPLSRREPYRETPTSVMESFQIMPDKIALHF